MTDFTMQNRVESSILPSCQLNTTRESCEDYSLFKFNECQLNASPKNSRQKINDVQCSAREQSDDRQLTTSAVDGGVRRLYRSDDRYFWFGYYFSSIILIILKFTKITCILLFFISLLVHHTTHLHIIPNIK